jgi:hypothetical protein
MIQDGRDDREAARGEASQRLDRGAAAVAAEASCVGRWHVDRLCSQSGPGVTAAEAEEALKRRGVRVADLPRLPAQPPAAIALYPDFADLVARLGRKLSIELVFRDAMMHGFSLLGGIRLDDGRHLDKEAIVEAQRQMPAGAHHDDWHRVLSILADAAQDPGALDGIVFWEVVEVLRPLARLGYPQRAITVQAAGLSLERSEAEVLAAAVAEEHEIRESPHPQAAPGTPPPDAVQDTPPPSPQEPDEPAAPGPGPAPPVPLAPVRDLQVRTVPGRTDIVQLSWSPPPEGVVWLRLAAEPPPWPTGASIASRDANSYGQPLSASGTPGPDRRISRELTLPQERAFVTAMTVRDADAIVGRTAEITQGAPVRGLSARRFGEEVRLTWIWPDEAVAAQVGWQPAAAAEDERGSSAGRQQRRCSRRAYHDEGGFAAVMGHAAQRVEVRAVIAGPGDERITAPAEIEVPAIGIPVRYEFGRVPGLLNRFLDLARGRRRRELLLATEFPCALPDLIAVECRHPTVPLDPHANEIAAKIPGGPMDPGTPVRVVVELGADGPSWVACFVDAAQSAADRDQVTLVGPPQRVR